MCHDNPAVGSDYHLDQIPRVQRQCSLRSVDLPLECCAAGHGGSSILKHVDSHGVIQDKPAYIMKTYDEVETRAYEVLRNSNDILYSFTPKFGGEVHHGDLPTDIAEGRYIKLSNLLQRFGANPHVMDCKIGTRSFAEQEITNTKLREDLYRRMKDLDPLVLTAEENNAGAITKHRWMAFNDELTSLKDLGFRIDGIVYSGGATPKQALKEFKSLSEIADLVEKELLPVPPAAISRASRLSLNAQSVIPGFASLLECQLMSASKVLKDLKKLYECMQSSIFVKQHSFIGCSLLFICEAHADGAGVFLIDFAKTCPIPEGCSIDHRRPWEVGNHEDGLFIGMENVIACWKDVIASLSNKMTQELLEGSHFLRSFQPPSQKNIPTGS